MHRVDVLRAYSYKWFFVGISTFRRTIATKTLYVQAFFFPPALWHAWPCMRLCVHTYVCTMGGLAWPRRPYDRSGRHSPIYFGGTHLTVQLLIAKTEMSGGIKDRSGGHSPTAVQQPMGNSAADMTTGRHGRGRHLNEIHET